MRKSENSPEVLFGEDLLGTENFDAEVKRTAFFGAKNLALLHIDFQNRVIPNRAFQKRNVHKSRELSVHFGDLGLEAILPEFGSAGFCVHGSANLEDVFVELDVA